MELEKLISKLKEIPFENWERKRDASNWNYWRIEINKHKIKIGILYPQHHLDDTKINLELYSPKNEILLNNIYTEEIGKIAMGLEETNNKKLNLEKYKTIKNKRKKINLFLESI
jgi:hypothetical protein